MRDDLQPRHVNGSPGKAGDLCGASHARPAHDSNESQHQVLRKLHRFIIFHAIIIDVQSKSIRGYQTAAQLHAESLTPSIVKLTPQRPLFSTSCSVLYSSLFNHAPSTSYKNSACSLCPSPRQFARASTSCPHFLNSLSTTCLLKRSWSASSNW